MIRGIPEGISVFPLLGSGGDPKQPHLGLCPRWSVYADRRPTEGELDLWQRNGSGWWGCPGGAVNGGLVVMDFDIPEKLLPGWERSALPPAHYQAWRELVEEHLGRELLESLPVSATLSGGRHVWWRCPDGPHGSGPRARRPQDEPDGKRHLRTLIETKGAGGYVGCPPTPGYAWEHLGWDSIPTLDAETGEALLRCADLLDESPPPAEVPAPARRAPAGGAGGGAGDGDVRIGDWFDANVDWDDVLLPLGWTRAGTWGGRRTYRHPSASARLSAVVGGDGDRMRCFSSNVDGIEPATGGTRNAYGKFRFLALNQHGGDFAAAARWVRDRYPSAPGRRPAAALRVERGGRSDAPAEGSAALAAEPGADPDGKPSKRPRAPRPEKPPGPADGRPEVVVSGRDPEEVARDVAGILAGGFLYSRGGLPTTVWERDGRAPEAAVVDAGRLTSAAAAAMLCWRITSKGEWVPRTLPPDVATVILGRSADRWGLPPLRGITACPVPGAADPAAGGYDPDTGWFSCWSGRLDPPAEDAGACYRWLLEEWLADFPFDGDASAANAVALALTLYARPAIDGPCPMWLVEAPTPGTGKTLLAQVLALPALGQSPAAMAATASEEELEKRVTSVILAAAPFALLDNVDRKLESSSLTMALTSTLYRARLMGTHQAPEVPATTVWAATANNATVSRDLARRSVVVRLDARTPEPEKRTGYRHPDIVAWTKRHRARILGALDTILAAWRAAGEPDAPGPRRGSYEAWHGLVGGAVVHAGGAQFLANDEEFRQRATPEDAEWAALVDLWWRERGTQRATGMDIRDLAVGEGLLGSVIGDGPDSKTLARMGRALGRMVDRVFVIDGQRLAIRRGAVLHGKSQYQLQQVDQNGAENGGPPPNFEPGVEVGGGPTPHARETRDHACDTGDGQHEKKNVDAGKNLHPTSTSTQRTVPPSAPPTGHVEVGGRRFEVLADGTIPGILDD